MRALAVALAAVALLASGCADDPDERQEPESVENQEIVDAIAADLDRPAGGFTSIDGVYRDDASATQEVTFTIRCERCSGASVIDDVVRAVWHSEIDPLRTISVSVNGPDGYESETVVVADEEADLIERYGERGSH